MSTNLARRKFIVASGAIAAVTQLPVRTAQAQLSDPTQPGATAYPAPKGERSLRIGNLIELEQEASKVIPPGAFAYIAAGFEREE